MQKHLVLHIASGDMESQEQFAAPYITRLKATGADTIPSDQTEIMTIDPTSVTQTKDRLKRFTQPPYLIGASLTIGGIIALTLVAFAKSSPTPLQASTSLNQIPGKLSSSLPAPAPSPIPLSTPSPSPSPQPIDPSALTPEERALNEKAKQELLQSSAPVDSFIEMKVAIAEKVLALTVSFSTATDALNPEGQAIGHFAANQSYSVEVAGDGIRINGKAFPGIVMISLPPDGLFTLNERTYHGHLILAVDGGKLWAVNQVNMRQYLHSVVGSEVSPSWDMEALKAQAIAARSYALTYYYKPMSGLFDLGATEYYQVYRGIEREADRTSQAVDETSGQFVSYRGGVVESLYAASDDIVMEAFQGKGMSQLGALDLAEQGYSHQQILSRYYPGTGIGQILMDQQ
ncbi:SpoIID/LytB domain-containing protein [Leptolyngbya sp. GB1-A1]|uniref:SpoIID/LytB domain-containing protein n=1 Tax=Leptolyngbya sp. GB1-A1 TaxID=2933908 RepID=UPI00329A2B73